MVFLCILMHIFLIDSREEKNSRSIISLRRMIGFVMKLAAEDVLRQKGKITIILVGIFRCELLELNYNISLISL